MGKKTSVAMVMLGAFAADSQAQSNVTIYGQLHLTVQKTSGRDPLLDIAPGYNQVGFRGSEALSSDLSAIFDLQLRFSPESGGMDGAANPPGATPSQTRGPFQGKSILGLSSKQLGSLQIGRQLTPLGLNGSKGDAGISGAVGSLDALPGDYYSDATPGGIRSNGGLVRTDMIQYTTPTWSGLNLSYGFGPRRSASSGIVLQQAKHFHSVWVNYTVGSFYVGGGAERNRRGDKVIVFNSTYELPFVRLHAGYGLMDSNDAAPTVMDGTTPVYASASGPKSKRYQLGASAPFGALRVGLGWAKLTKEGNGPVGAGRSPGFNRFGANLTYSLSARTQVLASFKTERNLTSRELSKSADFGLRHYF